MVSEEKVLHLQPRRQDWVKKHRGVEQLVARRAHNPKVVGSSPAPATTRHWRNPVPFYFP